ncbi:hypothetical protein ACIBL6_30395 [Streptomyces sp. NPDC050400]|uniref:hypothetical protein n=1 Tax=Streptomyces sp. NPDC050400 TaxID=3365610 RepID=UPI0037B662CD
MSDRMPSRVADCERRLTELRSETESLLKELEDLRHAAEAAPTPSEAETRANGQAILAGSYNFATAVTYLAGDQADPATLQLHGQRRGLHAVGLQKAGVYGYSPNQTGVHGDSVNGPGVRATSEGSTALEALSTRGIGAAVSGNGTGLVADNASPEGGVAVVALGQAKGIGLYASGERAAVQLARAPYAGSPKADYHDVGEIVLDSKADLYLCRKAGTPGSWAKLN